MLPYIFSEKLYEKWYTIYTFIFITKNIFSSRQINKYTIEYLAAKYLAIICASKQEKENKHCRLTLPFSSIYGLFTRLDARKTNV